jgi:hypothetical protein
MNRGYSSLSVRPPTPSSASAPKFTAPVAKEPAANPNPTPIQADAALCNPQSCGDPMADAAKWERLVFSYDEKHFELDELEAELDEWETQLNEQEDDYRILESEVRELTRMYVDGIERAKEFEKQLRPEKLSVSIVV